MIVDAIVFLCRSAFVGGSLGRVGGGENAIDKNYDRSRLCGIALRFSVRVIGSFYRALKFFYDSNKSIEHIKLMNKCLMKSKFLVYNKVL